MFTSRLARTVAVHAIAIAMTALARGPVAVLGVAQTFPETITVTAAIAVTIASGPIVTRFAPMTRAITPEVLGQRVR